MRPVPCSPKLPMQIRRRAECTNQSNRLVNGVRISARKKSWSKQLLSKSSLRPIGAILHCQSDLNRFASIYIDYYLEQMGAEEGRRREKVLTILHCQRIITIHIPRRGKERASISECASLQWDAARQAHSNKKQKLCDPQRAPCD